jgi:hypothetical protein
LCNTFRKKAWDGIIDVIKMTGGYAQSTTSDNISKKGDRPFFYYLLL